MPGPTAGLLIKLVFHERVATKAALADVSKTAKLIIVLAFLTFEIYGFALRSFEGFASLPVPRRHGLALSTAFLKERATAGNRVGFAQSERHHKMLGQQLWAVHGFLNANINVNAIPIANKMITSLPELQFIIGQDQRPSGTPLVCCSQTGH